MNTPIKIVILLICFNSVVSLAQPMNWYFFPFQDECQFALDTAKNLCIFSEANIRILKRDEINNCEVRISSGHVDGNFPGTFLLIRSNGEIWRPSYNGFKLFTGIDFSPGDTSKYSPIPYAITSGFETSDGKIVVGTDRNGVFIFNGSKWDSIPNSIVGKDGNSCLKLAFEDKVGNLWAYSGLYGLYCYRIATKTWDHYTKENSGMTFNYINRILYNRFTGDILIGSTDFSKQELNATPALIRFDGTTWYKYDRSNSGIPSPYMMAMALDSTGAVWLATASGLTRWFNNSFYFYSIIPYSNPGILAGFISYVSVDADNNIWLFSHSLNIGLLYQKGQQCNNVFKFYIDRPNSSTKLNNGDLLRIIWSGFNDIPFIRLYYRIGNSEWVPICKRIGDTGDYPFRLPNCGSNEYQIKVISADYPEVFAISDRFTVIGETANIAPVIDAPDTIDVYENQRTELSVNARDANGDSTHISFASLPPWITVTHDTLLSITAIKANNGYRLTIFAEDSHNAKDTAFMIINVKPAVDVKKKTENNRSANDKTQLIYIESLHTNVSIPEGKFSHIDIFDLNGRRISNVKRPKNQTNLPAVAIVRIKYLDKNYQKIVINSK